MKSTSIAGDDKVTNETDRLPSINNISDSEKNVENQSITIVITESTTKSDTTIFTGVLDNKSDNSSSAIIISEEKNNSTTVVSNQTKLRKPSENKGNDYNLDNAELMMQSSQLLGLGDNSTKDIKQENTGNNESETYTTMMTAAPSNGGNVSEEKNASAVGNEKFTSEKNSGNMTNITESAGNSTSALQRYIFNNLHLLDPLSV